MYDNEVNLSDILTVKIEKISNLGFGIAKVNGYVIFVENACPNDVLKIKITKRNKSYSTAEIVEILEPSPYRVEPFCKMQKLCGACQMQYINYDEQLKLKKEIVKDTMTSIYGYEIDVKEVIPSPQIKEYRHKIQYPVGEKASGRIVAGYYKTGSHDLINIKHCPIQPKQCDEIMEFIKTAAIECNVSGYKEKIHQGELRHVVIRTSSLNNKSLVVLVVNANTISSNIKILGERLYKEISGISGVCINFNNRKTNLILGEKTAALIGNDYIEEALCDKIFKIGAKTFFQVNPKSADNIFRYIREYVKSNFPNSTVLDAYAGISTFGICLSDIVKSVVTVEEEKDSVKLAKDIIKENNIVNVDAFCSDTEKFFASKVQSGEKFDIILLDPPRKGCSAKSLDYAMKLVNTAIIYVSCNPATLARDLKYLRTQGYKADFIQSFDMFPHSYHIENAVIIKKQM